MDALLARLGVQAMNMAIRSGLALTSTYAFSQCSRLMKTVDDKTVRLELKKLQKTLDSKIKVVSPAIDLIEFKSGRGNVFLESALPLAKGLHQDIIALGRRVEQAAEAGEAPRGSPRRSIDAEHQLAELKAILNDMKDLLARIDRDTSLLHMAITASGESLNSSMSPSISPSRLLQAGMFLTFGDTQYAADPSRPVQIGPAFTLSIYMLFVGHAAKQPNVRPDGQGQPPGAPQTPRRASMDAGYTDTYGFEEGERKPLWQEVIHKARVRLCRTPPDHVFDADKGFRPTSARNCNFSESDLFGPGSHHMGQRNEYAYHLEIIEDMDDGRAHDDLDTQAASYDDIDFAGIRESMPIHQISKIFYADTGRILNIGSDGGADNNPVLLLKRDSLAKTPSQMQAEMMAYTEDAASKAASGHESSSDEQDDIDRQLREESAVLDTAQESARSPTTLPRRQFPRHLDPEWIALEVFEEDEDENSETEDEDVLEEGSKLRALASAPALTSASASSSPSPMGSRRARPSLDSRLMSQIQNLSLQSSPSIRDMRTPPQSFSQGLAQHSTDNTESFVQRSPFGAVTTSLSLMEMLIRLTSLQEFQQASHLTIHDHILTFFLEETSTTGLKGEDRLKARTEAKQRVGFDPYTDTPSR